MLDEIAASGVREVVEATAGNTGIALACLARARGMRFTACVPDNTSAQKVALLQALADEVVLCAHTAKMGEPEHFQSRAAALAAERGARFACQFDNPANAAAHRATTGPELWAQSGGRLDAVALAAGTGGTIAGVSQALAGRAVRCWLANPQSSCVTVDSASGAVRLKTEAELATKLPSIIGEQDCSCLLFIPFLLSPQRASARGGCTGIWRAAPLAGAVAVSDAEAIGMTRFLLRREGFFVGASSGVNLCAAVRVARLLGPGHTVASVLCDSGALYLDKHWGPRVAADLGLPPDCGADLSFLP